MVATLLEGSAQRNLCCLAPPAELTAPAIKCGTASDGAWSRRNTGALLPAVQLRELLALDGAESCLVVPGVSDALTAGIARRELGFEVLQVLDGNHQSAVSSVDSKALLMDIRFAVPDALLIVSCDTGRGGSLQVRHAVHRFGLAGAACVIVEDSFTEDHETAAGDKHLLSFMEACARVRAAVNARDEMGEVGPLIMASTGARAQSHAEAVRRGRAFAAMGADVVFLEAMASDTERREDSMALPQVHKVVNLADWGNEAPLPRRAALSQDGYKILLHPTLLATLAVDGGLLPKASTGMEAVQEKQGRSRKNKDSKRKQSLVVRRTRPRPQEQADIAGNTASSNIGFEESTSQAMQVDGTNVLSKKDHARSRTNSVRNVRFSTASATKLERGCFPVNLTPEMLRKAVKTFASSCHVALPVAPGISFLSIRKIIHSELSRFSRMSSKHGGKP